MELTAEWWDQACAESLSVNRKSFLVMGDSNPTSMLTEYSRHEYNLSRVTEGQALRSHDNLPRGDLLGVRCQHLIDER